MRTGWRVECRVGPAASLHRRWPPPDAEHQRAVAVCRVTGPRTLVLGSTQPAPSGDDPPGLALTRRPSGGGAVLVWPGAQAWIELWLPRHDDRFDDDVVRAAAPLGEHWVHALAAVGVAAPTAVHRGRLEAGRFGSVVCFAGIGPGEVTVDGRKVVGLSQRRTRSGVRFQTTVPLLWDGPGTVAALVTAGAIAASAAPALLADVAGAATGLRDLVTPGSGPDLLGRVEDAFVDALAGW